MSRLVRVDELRPGDLLRLPRVEPVFVEEVIDNGDGRLVVRWWRPTGEALMRRRRHIWKHPRRPDGKPARLRLFDRRVAGHQRGDGRPPARLAGPRSSRTPSST